jgi:uncharacterized protein YhbP (UPF0306 family)
MVVKTSFFNSIFYIFAENYNHVITTTNSDLRSIRDMKEHTDVRLG